MINLLPPEERETLIFKKRFKIVLILGTLFLIFLAFLGSFLLSLKIFVSSQADSERERFVLKRKEIETSEAQALREKTTFFNSNLSKLDSFFEDQIFLTDVFEEINQLLPEGTYLTSFFYQEDKKQFSLTGFAPTREVLFELKKNFEEKEEIMEFNFPPSNWVEPRDIDFHLSFQWKEK